MIAPTVERPIRQQYWLSVRARRTLKRSLTRRHVITVSKCLHYSLSNTTCRFFVSARGILNNPLSRGWRAGTLSYRVRALAQSGMQSDPEAVFLTLSCCTASVSSARDLRHVIVIHVKHLIRHRRSRLWWGVLHHSRCKQGADALSSSSG